LEKENQCVYKPILNDRYILYNKNKNSLETTFLGKKKTWSVVHILQPTRTCFYLESFDYQILLFSRKKCLKIFKNYIF
jgi:hypothetical protein